MKGIEAGSGLPVSELMAKAAQAAADAIKQEISTSDQILILAGNGNNGGDGFVICSLLNDYNCRVAQVCGKPKTEEALAARKALDRTKLVSKTALPKAIEEADIIIDAVFGFGYKGELKAEVRRIFRMVNSSKARVFSIDINSGCEADTGHFDNDAVRSDITYALDCYKPMHMLRKEHGLFREVRLLDLGLPHPEESPFAEMDEDIFFANFPKKAENAYKGTYGKTLLIGGSWGMAGALCLNITGAKTVGAPYIDVCIPEEIYSIVATRHRTAVYHPFVGYDPLPVIRENEKNASAIAFGSGAVYMGYKDKIQDMLLQDGKVPVVLDAEAINLLKNNTYLLRFVKCPVIITPHVGEFASLINQPTEVIMDRKMEYAMKFAKENHVFIVLKGPNTIVASPTGECYINQSGSPALAQAGSGDLLTGILAGILTMTNDLFTGICMAVWLHGYLAELGCEEHAMQNFDLERYPDIMDKLFKKHGY